MVNFLVNFDVFLSQKEIYRLFITRYFLFQLRSLKYLEEGDRIPSLVFGNISFDNSFVSKLCLKDIICECLDEPSDIRYELLRCFVSFAKRWTLRAIAEDELKNGLDRRWRRKCDVALEGFGGSLNVLTNLRVPEVYKTRTSTYSIRVREKQSNRINNKFRAFDPIFLKTHHSPSWLLGETKRFCSKKSHYLLPGGSKRYFPSAAGYNSVSEEKTRRAHRNILKSWFSLNTISTTYILHKMHMHLFNMSYWTIFGEGEEKTFISITLIHKRDKRRRKEYYWCDAMKIRGRKRKRMDKECIGIHGEENIKLQG